MYVLVRNTTNVPEHEMAWTHCVSDIPIKDWSLDHQVHSVAVDGCVYLFGYSKSCEEDGMQVITFNPKTYTWGVIQPPCGSKENIDSLAPKDEFTFFVEAHNQKVYVCVGGYENLKGHEMHVFDTRSYRWSCVPATGDVPSGQMVISTCENDGHVYVCADHMGGSSYHDGSYIWDLELSTMRWKLLAKKMWGYGYGPQYVAPYQNRIYVLLERYLSDNVHKFKIICFDLVSRTWEWLHPPGMKPFSRQNWLPFVRRNQLYVLLKETRLDDYSIVRKFGKRRLNEIVLKYSLAWDEWEQVWFNGITPSDALHWVCVVDNKSIFFSFYKQKAYVLDFLPSLSSMCLQVISKYQLHSCYIPEELKRELSMYKYSSE